MPLIELCTVDAFDRNVRIAIREGADASQAIAIARETLERVCREEDKPVPTRRPIAEGTNEDGES